MAKIVLSERRDFGLFNRSSDHRYLKEIERYAAGTRLKDLVPTPRGQMVKVAGLVLASKVFTTKRKSDRRLYLR